MKLTYKTLPFLKAKAEGDGSTFSGCCAVFHNGDAWGETQAYTTVVVADTMGNSPVPAARSSTGVPDGRGFRRLAVLWSASARHEGWPSLDGAPTCTARPLSAGGP